MPRLPRIATDKTALVLGTGGWGTAFSVLLSKAGFRTVLVPHRRAERAAGLRKTRSNPEYLPGVRIPRKVVIAEQVKPWIDRTSWLFLAVPMKGLAGALSLLAPLNRSRIAIISLTKGLDPGSLRRPSEMIQEALGVTSERLAVLSGPSHAEEVSRGAATAVVVASQDRSLARSLQSVLSGPAFRVYTSGDVAGVELAGALKNVIALAAGMCDGLGLGDNAKAALLTRGLAEMTRLGVALRAERETFFGLAGTGDLIVTCYSRHGRNRRVGEMLGRGRRLETILLRMGMVAEGVGAAEPALALARRAGVDLPICAAVAGVLKGAWSARMAMRRLLGREPGPEWS